MIRPRPKVILDIKTSKLNPFSLPAKRIFLRRSKIVRVPLQTALKALFLLGVFSYLIFGSAVAPVYRNQYSQSFAAQGGEEARLDLEQQLAQMENQIAEYEGTIQSYKKEGTTLQKEIDKLNAKIAKLDLQIKATELSLKRLDQEIDENENQIKTTESDIDLNKGALAGSLQKVYENENISLVALLLKNPKLSDFFGDITNLIELQSNLTITLKKIIDLKNDLLEEKETLSLKRTDAAALKAYQASQKVAAKDVKGEKNNLLTVTKGKESAYQELLKETKKTAAQIRGRIFDLLGGGELTFEEAYKLAKFAEQATGARAALILAVLDRESALGQNVGRCSYEKAMHPTRDLPKFLALLSDLKAAGKAPPEPVMVSCPNRDGYFGGAMGSAQFIPSTWVLYGEKISEINGSNPPNPWNNGDAFVATALYLKDSLRGCNGAYDKQFDIEKCAAAKYYAGSKWRSHISFGRYGYRVAEQARKFQQDIDILNSQ